MNKLDVYQLAMELAYVLDRHVGSEQHTISLQFKRRRISLTGVGEVTYTEVQAAMRELGTCLPDKAAVWLNGRLRKIDRLEALAEVLVQLSLASIPVEKRKLAFYANHEPYQALLGFLYETFLWYLVAPKTGGQVTDMRPVYRRLIYSHYNRLAGRFAIEPSAKTPVDELINQAFDAFFGHGHGPEVTADPAMELLIKELLPRDMADQAGAHDDPAIRNLVREATQEYGKEIESLRGQIAKLNADLQKVLKQMRGRHYVTGEPVVSQDKWQTVRNSPEHEVELGWLMSQVPDEEHEAVLGEVALAVSQEQKMPTLERYREILSEILKRQKRLIC